MKDTDIYWNMFLESGSVQDYLIYRKAVLENSTLSEGRVNADKDKGTGAQGTEYR